MDITNLEENNLPLSKENLEIGSEIAVSKKKKKKKTKKSKEISYKQEVLRKAIHLFSLSIPIVYIFFRKEQMLWLLIPLTLLMIIADISTKRIPMLGGIYQKIFGQMLRKHEKKKKKLLLNGASWVLISSVITVFMFPKIIAVTGFTILIVSDISAALIGRKFGKTPLFNKSWEGTIAFIVSAIMVIFIYGFTFDAPISYFIIGSIAAIVGGFVEAASKVLKMDDNFSIPISIGLVMWLCAYLTANYMFSFLNLL